MMLRKYFGPSIILLLSVCVASVFGVVKPTSIQKTCTTEECHTVFGEKAYLHGPVGLGNCQACHKPVDPNKHSWEFVRKENDLCEYCHLDQATKKNVHEPLKTGQCLQCHDPHSSESEFMLHKDTVSEICSDCHQVDKGLSYLHGPVAMGECTICHSSHSSDHESLLKSDPTELCFGCHVVTRY